MSLANSIRVTGVAVTFLALIPMAFLIARPLRWILTKLLLILEPFCMNFITSPKGSPPKETASSDTTATKPSRLTATDHVAALQAVANQSAEVMPLVGKMINNARTVSKQLRPHYPSSGDALVAVNSFTASTISYNNLMGNPMDMNVMIDALHAEIRVWDTYYKAQQEEQNNGK